MISSGDEGIKQRENKNKSFLSRVNKKQNVELGSPVSSGVPGNYMKYVRFSWLPLEAALSLCNFSFFFLLKQFFLKELIKNRLPSVPNHKLCKMSILKRSV